MWIPEEMKQSGNINIGRTQLIHKVNKIQSIFLQHMKLTSSDTKTQKAIDESSNQKNITHYTMMKSTKMWKS